MEQEQSFYEVRTPAVFQNENKSDLEYIALIEKDVISKRKPVLLKLFLKRSLSCVFCFFLVLCTLLGTEQGKREEAHLLALKIVTSKVGNLVVLRFVFFFFKCGKRI